MKLANILCEAKEKRRWKVIARHKYVQGAIITESYDRNDDSYRKYVAVIRDWRHFNIYRGKPSLYPNIFKKVLKKVGEIRDRIDAGDESVFQGSKNDWWLDETGKHLK